MYLKRKIDKEISEWKKRENHSPLLIVGMRQCGKTCSIREFAKNNYENPIYINFWNDPSYKDAFDVLNVDEIIKKLSLNFPSLKTNSKNTLIILDEIQDCPKARLSLKNFKEDGRFDIIATGSYIGLNIDDNSSISVPKPNGAEEVLFMKSIDFEEYLWANGYDEEQVDQLLEYFNNRKEIPSFIHEKMKSLFKEYICIGGYPLVVRDFIQNHNFSLSFRENNSLIFDIKGDPSKRKDKSGNSLYTPYEIARIQNAYDLIGLNLQKDEQRFVVSKIEGGNGIQKQDAVNYLLNASVVYKANNLTNPSLPLKLSMIPSQFKLFYADIGSMMTICGLDTIKAVLQGHLGMNKGALYEAIVSESLYKADVPLYYFKKNSGLEVDFVISYDGYPTLIEVKAKNGNVKSSKTILKHKEHYGETRLIKICDTNIGYENDILTIPYYLTFALGKDNFKI